MSRERPPTTSEVARQFDEHARQFAVSRLHEQGAARLMLIEHMEPVVDETLLDIGTGPGPVALAFSPYVRRVVGLDASEAMLAAAQLAARRREADNLEWVAGDAHGLPFKDRAFDLVTARACAHHFADVRAAVREIARVLRRGGRLGIADGTVPEDDELDTFINQLDLLHDPTTVRNYRPSEWEGFVAESGLRLDWCEPLAYELAEGRLLSEWMSRSGASSTIFEEGRRRLLEAPERVRRFLRVKAEGEDVRFDLPRLVLVARRTD